MAERSDPQAGAPVAIASLTSIESLGFTGGRNSFHAFCASAFAPDMPRLLRTDFDELVVYCHEDLRVLGAMPELGVVPPHAMFPGLHTRDADEPAMLGDGIGRVISNQVFTQNPPVHGPMRMTLWRELNPKQAAQMEETAREVVRDILGEVEARDEIDFVTDVAGQLTLRFWGRLIGLTRDEQAQLAVAIDGMTNMFHLSLTMDAVLKADEGMRAFGQIIETAVMRSHAAGSHPLVERLAASLKEVDVASDPDVAGMVAENVGKLLAGNLVDGFHTAAVGAANMVYTLLRFPDVMADLQASPEKTGTAVMEALRCEPPVIALKRYALADIEYGGVVIPKGAQVLMLWAAGNHDPDVFEAPLEFRLDRNLRGVTTFGGGAHICVGRVVATMLAQVLLEELGKQDFELALVDEDYPWFENFLMSQMIRMPVAVRRASAQA
jgi:cytochrome P450